MGRGGALSGYCTVSAAAAMTAVLTDKYIQTTRNVTAPASGKSTLRRGELDGE